MILEKAYREIMEHVVVTEDMHYRVLDNIQNADLKQKKPISPVLRYCAAAACLALLVIGIFAIPHAPAPVQNTPPPHVQQGVPNFRQVSSIEDLAEAVGFQIHEPAALPFAVTDTGYFVYGNRLAEIKYRNDEQMLTLRKTIGTEDPSGDYTAYTDTRTLDIGGISFTLRGNAGTYALAVWQNGDYACSVQYTGTFSTDEWADLLTSLYS